MDIEQAQKTALDILTEAGNVKQEWLKERGGQPPTKMVVVPMDVLSALTLKNLDNQKQKGELCLQTSQNYPTSGGKRSDTPWQKTIIPLSYTEGIISSIAISKELITNIEVVRQLPNTETVVVK